MVTGQKRGVYPNPLEPPLATGLVWFCNEPQIIIILRRSNLLQNRWHNDNNYDRSNTQQKYTIFSVWDPSILYNNYYNYPSFEDNSCKKITTGLRLMLRSCIHNYYYATHARNYTHSHTLWIQQIGCKLTMYFPLEVFFLFFLHSPQHTPVCVCVCVCMCVCVNVYYILCVSVA